MPACPSGKGIRVKLWEVKVKFQNVDCVMSWGFTAYDRN
jgi:hypothetical protein